jgi:hypothetical protein
MRRIGMDYHNAYHGPRLIRLPELCFVYRVPPSRGLGTVLKNVQDAIGLKGTVGMQSRGSQTKGSHTPPHTAIDHIANVCEVISCDLATWVKGWDKRIHETATISSPTEYNGNRRNNSRKQAS